MLFALGAAFCLPLLLLAAGLLAANSESGQRFLRAQLAGVLSVASGYDVSITSVSGDLFDAVALEKIVLRDTKGVWLTVERLDLAWRPRALLQRRLEVARLHVDAVSLMREPLPVSDGPAEPGSGELALPFDIDVETVSIDSIVLGAPLLGREYRFTFLAGLRLRDETRLDLRAALDYLGDRPGRLSLSLDYDLGRGSFDLDAEVFDAAGGLLADLLQRPDLAATDLRLTGEGSLENWNGRLSGSLGSLVDTDLALSAAGPSPWRGTASGKVDLGALLPEELRSLFAGMTIDAAAFLADDGWLQAERLIVEAGPASLAASGRFEPVQGTLEATGKLEIRDGRNLPDGLFPAAFASAQARFTAAGSLASPRLDLGLALEEVALPGLRSAHIGADLSLASDDASSDFFDVSGNGVVADPDFGDADLNRLAGGPLAWSLRGRLPSDASVIEIAAFEFDGPTLNMSASGSLQPSPLTANFDLAYRVPALAPLLPPAMPAVTGGTDGRAGIALQADGTVEARIDGALTGFSSGDAVLQALLGATPGYGMTLRLSESDGLTIADMQVAGSGATVSGGAAIDAAWQRLAADYRVDIADLAVLGTAVDLPLTGRLAASGTAAGPLADPSLRLRVTETDVTLAGTPIDALSLDVTADQVATAAAGRLALRAGVAGQRLNAATDFRLADTERLELSQLTIATEQGDSLTGQIAWRLGAAAVNGDLSAMLPNLALWQSLLGIDLAGAVNADIDLTEREARQDASIVAAANGLALPDRGAAWRLGETRVTLHAADLFGAARAEIELRAEGPTGAERGLAGLELSGAGDLERFRLSLAARGALEQPFDLASDIEVAAGGGQAVTVKAETARITYGPLQTALKAPVSLVLGKEGVTLSDLDLGIDQGRLTGGFTIGPEKLQGDLRAQGVPLVLLDLVPGAPAIDGVLDLRLALEGSGAQPRGTLSVAVAGLRSRDAAALNLPPGALTATARLTPDGVDLEAELRGLAESPLQASARLPLLLSLTPFTAQLPPDGRIDGRLQWAGDAADIVTLLAFDRIALSGAIEADLTVAGSLAAPVAGGGLTLRQGRYENYLLGTVLEELELQVTPSGHLVTLAMQGRDANAGELSITAEADFSDLAAPQFDATANLSALLVAQRDDVRATVSGSLRAAGTPDNARVEGKLTGDRVEVRLVDALPPSVVEIAVVDPAAPAVAQPAAPTPQEQTPRLALDLVLDLPSRVYISGRGLESEWGGGFQVKGSELDPQVSGKISPLRGSFDFVGKRFRLGEGAITLPEGGGGDAELNLSATHNGDDLVTTVTVSGSATSPKLAFSSQPSLPEEEILSRLLFDRSSTQLDPLQAVQLAQAAATLSGVGQGPGIFDLARSTLGVDVFGIAPGEAGELGRLEAGKYLTDEIYVGVEQGTGVDSTAATVEVEVTPNISIKTEAGANQSGKTKVQFKWDY